MSLELGGNPPLQVEVPAAAPVALSQPDVAGQPVALMPAAVPQALTPGDTGSSDVAVLPVSGPAATSEPMRIIRSGIAAHNLSGHRVVTPGPDGLRYASADEAGDAQAPLWVTIGAALAGQAVAAVAYGPLEEPTWAWQVGPVYLSADGQLTQQEPTAPDSVFVAAVGFASSPTDLFVDRSPSIVLA